jgi:hypothetical protein
MEKLCVTCSGKVYAKGLCNRCYQRIYKRNNKPKYYECPKCGSTTNYQIKSKGFCNSCNSKEFYVKNREKVIARTCKFGLEKTRKKKGIPLDSPYLQARPGAGHICKNSGYKYITVRGHPNAGIRKGREGRMCEHTFIMSQHLGRALRKEESVHHKNGIRDDNSIDNLELWHKGQPAGQRVEDKIKWCKDFLKLYGET